MSLSRREEFLMDAGAALADDLHEDILRAIMERDKAISERKEAEKQRNIAFSQAIRDERKTTALIMRCNDLYGQLCKAKKQAPQDDPQVCRILLDALEDSHAAHAAQGGGNG